MEQSILRSVKKALGIDESYDAFDLDILMHINSAFSTLNQLGMGPLAGFAIEDDQPVWAEFTEDDTRLSSVKTFVILSVRLVFDPPTLSYVLEAMQEQINQLAWRLNVVREGTEWTDPEVVNTSE